MYQGQPSRSKKKSGEAEEQKTPKISAKPGKAKSGNAIGLGLPARRRSQENKSKDNNSTSQADPGLQSDPTFAFALVASHPTLSAMAPKTKKGAPSAPVKTKDSGETIPKIPFQNEDTLRAAQNPKTKETAASSGSQGPRRSTDATGKTPPHLLTPRAQKKFWEKAKEHDVLWKLEMRRMENQKPKPERYPKPPTAATSVVGRMLIKGASKISSPSQALSPKLVAIKPQLRKRKTWRVGLLVFGRGTSVQQILRGSSPDCERHCQLGHGPS